MFPLSGFYGTSCGRSCQSYLKGTGPHHGDSPKREDRVLRQWPSHPERSTKQEPKQSGTQSPDYTLHFLVATCKSRASSCL